MGSHLLEQYFLEKNLRKMLLANKRSFLRLPLIWKTHEATEVNDEGDHTPVQTK